MKKKQCGRLGWLLAAFVMLWGLPGLALAEAFDLGDGTGNGNWGVEGSVNLSISGNGAIHDYADPGEVPWVKNWSGYSSVTTLVVDEGITWIGQNAFASLSGLTTVSIPSTVESIYPDAFSGCTGITDIYYAGTGNQWASIAGGVSFPTADTMTVHCIGGMFYQRDNLLVGQTDCWVVWLADTDLAAAASDISQYTISSTYNELTLASVEVGSDNRTVTLHFSGTPTQADTLLTTISGDVFVGGNETYGGGAVGSVSLDPVNIKDTVKLFFAPGEGSGNQQTITAPISSAYTMPTVASIGFTAPEQMEFANWKIDGVNEIYAEGQQVDLGALLLSDSTLTTDLIVLAVWQGRPVTVSFVANGGGGSMDGVAGVDNLRVGNYFTLPQCGFTPPEGKMFGGWLVDGQTKAAGTSHAFSQAGTNYVTAIWRDIPAEDEGSGDDNNNDSSGDSYDDNSSEADVYGSKEQGSDDNASVESVDTLETNESPEFVITGLGESYLQSMVKPEVHVDWYDRVDMPKYTNTLYETLLDGSDDDKLADYLIDDEYYILKPETKVESGRLFDVTGAETYTSAARTAFADGGFTADEQPFTQDEYMVIDVTAGDRAIDYVSLREGDVVRTSAFNGIFVTRLTKGSSAAYEQQRKDTCTYISTTFQAFDRDHPEIFWLSGKCKVRILTVTVKRDNKLVEEAYFFFVLADNQSFNLRSEAWKAQGAVAKGLERRDAAVSQILATVNQAGSRLQKVQALNSWLTLHNEYNTSADLMSIGNEPHECLSALEGRVGTNGPVCDGYARAFKTLCDKLAIPCVLEDGYARYAKDGGGEAHMWNLVQMEDGRWYGVDVTWNDPSVAGGVGAVSGRENERYLLVGTDTVINGLSFAASHPATNRVANGGVAFTNGPELSAATYNAALYQAGIGVRFADVLPSSWYYPAVEFVYDNGLMNGNADGRFAPAESLSRAMLVQILYNREERPEAAGAAFGDVRQSDWFAPAVGWAAEQRIAAGDENGAFAPNAAISREQLAVMLWRYLGSPEAADQQLDFPDAGEISSYAAEALAWAVEAGVMSGDAEGGLRPQASATRAEAAQMLQNLWAE